MITVDEFAQEAKQWLAENKHLAPRDYGAICPPDMVNEGLSWQKHLYASGKAGIHWPVEFGGQGLTAAHQAQWLYECALVGVPGVFNMVGLVLTGGAVQKFGTPEQQAKHLNATLRADHVWCQLFSEPGAGSDLGSLSTKAERDGDRYIVNGQKVWCSGGRYSNWGILMARTNADAPKHEGISFLLFSMDSPGVSVKPIELLNGHSPFCQTFFDDVQVPKIDLIHKENQGWRVATRLLQHERSGLASLASADKAGPLQRIKPSMPLPDLAKHYAGADVIADAVLRDEIVVNEMQKRAFNLTQARAVAESEADTPGAATSIFNYIEAEYVKDQLELQNRIRGTQAFGWEGDSFTSEEIGMCRLNLEAKSISIAGGSNEIQLNIIAKRVLGLPD